MNRRREARSSRAGRRRDQAGYAAILTAVFCAVLLLPLCAISVDVARWYLEIARVQNAADAAAAAGVTWLPDDFASATTSAKDVASDNGYTNSSITTVSTAVGEKPTQLVVTIRTKVTNQFGSAFGLPFTTISRSATADYNGPAPMGSPCNAFGNEPAGAATSATDPRGPSTSVISPPAGGASCSSNPQFWAAIAGPDTPKANGDQYMTRTCASGTDGCTGTDNKDFNPEGYFYIVRVAAAAVNQPVTVQIYDPSWVEQGDTCGTGPTNDSGVPLRNNMNPYTTTDGLARYALSTNTFCTGDVLNGGTTPITTSFGLRKPTDTYQPDRGDPITTCEKQYPGYLQNTSNTPDAISSGTLAKTKADNSTNSKYNDSLAQVFHQWVNFCTFTPTVAGDYYLQARTNVALSGTSDGVGGYGGNTDVFTQTDDDDSVHGNGNNRFSLRIKGTAAVQGAVSVAGWQNMSIYANYSGAAPTFNLVRVIPAAQTKTLNIHFFDVGDADNPGTITVLPPSESSSTLPAFTGCTGAGVTNGALGTGCSLSNVTSSSYNGKLQTISVPIPSTYSCNATLAGGCWVRLKMQFSGGVSDTTTWSASIDGDPVRLIK
jgi:Flp pilus assembly protein TadG